jgi:mannose-6-phosphate isomerase-like protein (cupin superfamily)
MNDERFQVMHIDQVPEPSGEKGQGDPDWHAIRIHFGIQSFGVNAYTATEPGEIVGEHDELVHSGSKHEELYYVSKGSATFTIDGEAAEAPEGTFVYVPDPASIRSAVAHEAGTTILCLGGTPGEAFTVSPWEQKYEQAASS